MGRAREIEPAEPMSASKWHFLRDWTWQLCVKASWWLFLLYVVHQEPYSVSLRARINHGSSIPSTALTGRRPFVCWSSGQDVVPV